MNTQNSLAIDPQIQKLLSASFNQDQGCFTISYEAGFRVYNSDPMELNVKREWDPSHNRSSGSSNPEVSGTGNSSQSSSNGKSSTNETGGGIGLAQMLHRTNYLALVGGGRNPRFPQNKVIIWDDLKRRPALSLEFLSPVLNVLLSRTHIVAVLAAKVHVFAFSSPPTRIASYETADNPHGVAVLANNVLAFPSRLDGQIQIVNLESHANNSFTSSATNLGFNTNNDRSTGHTSIPNQQDASVSNQTTGRTSNQKYHYHNQNTNLVTIIRAHKGPIRCLALNRTGTIIASASEMGTIIRLHSTRNTALLHEFRRGLDRAIIYAMSFSPSTSTVTGNHHQYNPLRLAVLSDKNTLHVFDASALVGAANSAGLAPDTGSADMPVNDTSSVSSSVPFTNGSSNKPTGTTTASNSGSSNSSQAPGASNSLANSVFAGVGSFFSGVQQLNRRHVLSKLPLMPRYFYSEWSFVSAPVDGQDGVIGWPSDDCVVIVWTDLCKWEKYVIVEKEHNYNGEHQNGHLSSSSHGRASSDDNHAEGTSDQYELVREAWRGFEDVSHN